jgi:L-ascorbate metabolism protein UlaG (beta-lactamase superfamily)
MKATPTSRVGGLVTGVLCVIAGALVGGGSRLPDAAATGGTSIANEQTAPERPKPGDADIWYLGHCGFAVRTSRHLLIFDYQELRDGPQPRVRPAKPGLDTGWIDPAEIGRDRVRVFVTHGHTDHFDRVIESWTPAVPDIHYFFGWQAGNDPSHHYLIGPRATWSKDGLDITTINSHHSDVPEVAFLVQVDGVVIYHNGDYQMDYEADFPYLATRATSIDLAFVPGVARPDLKYAIQNADLFKRFAPRAVFPMHAQAGAPMYLEFAEAFRQRTPGLPMMVPQTLGDRFVYRGRQISRATR